MLINAATPISLLEMYRIIWIGGKTGGYKSSVALRLAQEYLERGYRLVTNMRCMWADDPEDVMLDKDGHLKCVVILDEGGKDIKWTRQWEDCLSYVAKMDIIFIMASFIPPVKSAQMCMIQPIFNLKGACIPLVFYKWKVKHYAAEDKGSFFWWRPSEMYGIYSRQYPGDRAKKILSWLIRRKVEFEQFYNVEEGEDELFGVEEPSTEEKLLDFASQISEAAAGFQAIPARKRGKR